MLDVAKGVAPGEGASRCSALDGGGGFAGDIIPLKSYMQMSPNSLIFIMLAVRLFTACINSVCETVDPLPRCLHGNLCYAA